jgi:hypothetical protein
MTIELLYIAGCPNYEPALAGIREALQQEKLSADIREIDVRNQADAEATGFPGSPTIRINGVDVEPSARATIGVAMCCRTYGGRSGIPTVDLIRQALREFGNTTYR